MKKTVILIAFSLSLFILNNFGLMNWAKGGIGWVTGWRANIYKPLISGEKDDLSRDLAECRGNLIELNEENEQARRLLGTKTKPETSFELAKIVSIGSGEAILNLEYPESVEVNDSVVSGTFLLGRVNEVFGPSARVELLISPQSKLPVKIWQNQENSSSASKIRGEGVLISDGKSLFVEEILDKDSVETGDWVGAVIETGDIFWIGKIESVDPSEDNIFKKARVKWGVNLKKLFAVGVVK
jgi:cell shape-determining protein MreC